ncbi:hypothetical protein sos41_03350 [Alphaproteobacteria bacterium SO-S41]|nr:hypothetical protein sos41_03350 [Alphaproteobacteria bacterium SO-S41]
MLSTILKYGTIGGLIVGVPLFAMTVGKLMVHGVPGMVIGYLIMLIALSTVFVAIKRRRDVELGGVIRFWPALGLGLAISIVAGIFYVLAWEAALAVSGLDFGGAYVDALIEQQKAAGVTGEALAKFTAEMRQFAADYANPLYRLPMTFTEIFPVGVLVSLVSAGLLCNRRFLPVRRGPQAAAA